jgi:hypothetical protein
VSAPQIRIAHKALPVRLKIQAPTASPVSFVRAKIDAKAEYLKKIDVDPKDIHQAAWYVLIKGVVDKIYSRRRRIRTYI